MAMGEERREDAREVVKWYTRARKFPQLIGRTADGATIPGGPYTYTQIVSGVVVLVVGYQSVAVWGRFGLLGNAAVLLGVTLAVVFAVGRLPVGMRNPVSAAAGILRAVSASPVGVLGGRPLSIPRPHVGGARIRVEPTVPGVGEPVSSAPSAVEVPSPVGDHPAALTGVQRLLAAAGATGGGE